jgi:hypothetical protein
LLDTVGMSQRCQQETRALQKTSQTGDIGLAARSTEVEYKVCVSSGSVGASEFVSTDDNGFG